MGLRAGGRRDPDLGDFIVILMTGTLAALRDRLARDGFSDAADLVADLVDIADDYLTRTAPAPPKQPSGDSRRCR